ncbi:hypothetical protein Tco_0822410 [Tanacetum coccineum]|uniref:Retrovirus-related Pol polyprotein from transposon TNT 1-94-like beta-barrel domain-containing protein n=1 Tax=Tanacetum coccineum TaxID=301880 RepID=A0ABQ5AG19_9ASTR
MQRPPLFEANCFIYWKNKFETYVKSKDIDLWHIIVDGDYIPMVRNLITGKDETIPYDKLKDENKKMLSKNDEAKMVLYNALPKKDNEDDDPKKDEICLMAHDSSEVCLKVKLELDEWIKDSGCTRHMTGNKDLFSTYEAINGDELFHQIQELTLKQDYHYGNLYHTDEDSLFELS